MAQVETVHAELCDLLAGMMGSTRGHAPPRPHASFLALGGTEDQAAELTDMINALFGLELPRDAPLRSPTPDALARTVATEWFAGGGDERHLIELIQTIADAE